MIKLEHGYSVVRFSFKIDYMKVLMWGLWVVMGHYLTVTTWNPKFCPSVTTISLTMVWVCLSEMPIEFFNEKI